jgi:tRNA-specific 2-thiouridylase
VKFNSIRRCYELKKARDGKKDQAYFLYGIPAAILPNILFPLGNFTKSEVRDLARKFKLNTAEKAESQDICFVSDRDYKKFIRERLGEQAQFRENSRFAGKCWGASGLSITRSASGRLGLAMGFRFILSIDPETDTLCRQEEFLYTAVDRGIG